MVTETVARLDRIARLARLARRLERRGLYNGAKYVRAALQRELDRLATEDETSGAPGRLAEDLVALAAELAADYPAEFLERLPAIAAAAEADEPLPLERAPELWTCRECGELFVGRRPGRCPVCSAPAITFAEHRPIWFLDPIDPETALLALAAGPSRLEAILGERPDEELDRPPRPGEWSVRQALEHLAAAEELLGERVRRMLAEEEPDLVAVAAWAVVPADEPRPGSLAGRTARELLERFQELREETVALLGGLTPAEWQRTGRHPEWGRVTILSQAGYFARHEAAHVAQIAAAAEGRVPGEGRSARR
ncbi:MAG TPA: DinB family protein [Candidatus Limnocylindrales bacterium]|nr:DinB family protein [Candidatus Limnocylindrales bacterium]